MLSDEARAFYEDYRLRHADFEAAATFAEGLVAGALRDSEFNIHQIGARAKDRRSLLRKLRDKGYDHPSEEMTDRIGVRVITYFQDQVDPIAAVLRPHFVVDDERSIDQRSELSVSEFGYRSVHLIVQARLTGLEGPRAEPLRDLWFEIQVRSLLEHAWAEIDHDLKYKSGVMFPDGFVRNLALLAAQLEGIDADFMTLREERDRLIENYKRIYLEGGDSDETLDAARLAGLLEALLSQGHSFRLANATGGSLPRHVEASCVQALRANGITTATEFAHALEEQGAQERIESYASLEGIPAEEVSHFAVSVIVAAGNPEMFVIDFADLVDDANLMEVISPTEESGDLDGDL